MPRCELCGRTFSGPPALNAGEEFWTWFPKQRTRQDKLDDYDLVMKKVTLCRVRCGVELTELNRKYEKWWYKEMRMLRLSSIFVTHDKKKLTDLVRGHFYTRAKNHVREMCRRADVPDLIKVCENMTARELYVKTAQEMQDKGKDNLDGRDIAWWLCVVGTGVALGATNLTELKRQSYNGAQMLKGIKNKVVHGYRAPIQPAPCPPTSPDDDDEDEVLKAEIALLEKKLVLLKKKKGK